MNETKEKVAVRIDQDVVDIIAKADTSLFNKVTTLWYIWMHHYKQPIGDYAVKKITEVFGEEHCNILAYLTGYSGGISNLLNSDRLREQMEVSVDMILNPQDYEQKEKNGQDAD